MSTHKPCNGSRMVRAAFTPAHGSPFSCYLSPLYCMNEAHVIALAIGARFVSLFAPTGEAWRFDTFTSRVSVDVAREASAALASGEVQS